ncbi:hypothetical protein KKI24_21045 [bacterium]|nr:hypothetical protein [bacterium]
MKHNVPDVNEIAPDFTVSTESGNLFLLSKTLAAGNNILLVFYRGHW